MKRRALLAALLVSLGSWQALAAVAAAADAPATVIAGEKTLSIDHAVVEKGELWVPLDQVTAITGFELKPQGLCAGDVCLPLAADGSWMSDKDGVKRFCVTRFAKHADQAFAVDEARNTWCFTAVPQAPTQPLLAGQAPDFALTDREGKTVRLSDFRGKKVLLWTWASWCACRFDLKGWQEVYTDLHDKNFEIVACAQDTAGMDACKPWYDKAGVTFTALVDPHHTVSSLYQMVNVPTGVWIDETGKIVRPGEVAYSKQDKVLGQTIGDDRYALGVRDWVANGPNSQYVLAPDSLQSRVTPRSADERLAEAHFRLGTHFLAQGDRDSAGKHWKESQRLNPNSWNYHRQQWSFDKSTEMLNFLTKVRKLGDQPYYAPVEFPASKSP